MVPEIARRVLGAIKLDADEYSIWRRFRRNFSVSLSGTVVSLAIKAGQTLLLVRTLPMSDYGRVLIVLNLFGFLSSFVGVRVSDVMFRFFERLRHDQDDRALQGLLLFCLAISITTSSLIVFGVFLFSPWLSESLYHNRELAPLFNIYGGTVLLSS